jgi:hypothetical protein
VPKLLRYRPDPERIRCFLHLCMRRCHPGRPLLVDASEENALVVAATLEEAAVRQTAGERVPVAVPAHST